MIPSRDMNFELFNLFKLFKNLTLPLRPDDETEPEAKNSGLNIFFIEANSTKDY